MWRLAMSKFDGMPFKATHWAFDPPESIKKRREETLQVFTKHFGITAEAADVIRIMTETFFKAGMDRTAQINKMVQKGELTKQDFKDMLDGLDGEKKKWQ